MIENRCFRGFNAQWTFSLHRCWRRPVKHRDAVAPLRGRIGDRALADVRLVLSELVSNAVRHAPGEPISVSVDVDDDGVVRGAIEDHGEGGVRLRATNAGEPGGSASESSIPSPTAGASATTAHSFGSS